MLRITEMKRALQPDAIKEPFSFTHTHTKLYGVLKIQMQINWSQERNIKNY